MAKKTGGKVIQMLSPENYIRKKARSLPLFECMVNDDWEDSQIVQLTISRQHTNGNVTVCFYLVDLLCLGVKDTHFMFNVPLSQYHEQLANMKEEMEIIPIDYPLAHNIILSGIDFADEYGFKPHKDYTSITQFMLEEDTDDIELMEIECGINGEPVYYRGPFDDDAKMRRIITQLEKTAGPGNYSIVDTEDEDEEEDEDSFDDDDEFPGLSFDEKKDEFLKLHDKLSKQTKEESKRYISLINSLIYQLTDEKLYNEYYDKFLAELDIEILADEVPDELLGIIPGSLTDSEALKIKFINIFEMVNDDLKTAKIELEKLIRESPDFPGICFLEIQILQAKNSSKYAKRLEEGILKYPDYQLLNVIWIIEQISAGSPIHHISGFPFNLDNLYPNRLSIHSIELYYAIILKVFLVGIENDLNKIEALSSILYEVDLSEEQIEGIDYFISIIKINLLVKQLTNN